MLDNKTITQISTTIVNKIIETNDDFIYRTILPFCEDVVETKISKEKLRKILIAGSHELKCEKELTNYKIGWGQLSDTIKEMRENNKYLSEDINNLLGFLIIYMEVIENDITGEAEVEE